jgi:glycosyltransferase involved in cell wall biosynthesis
MDGKAVMNLRDAGIFHLDTQFGWRGGQQQAAYLLQHMQASGYRTAMICQPRSHLQRFCRDQELPVHEVRVRGEWDGLAGYHVARICRAHGVKLLHTHAAHAHAIGLWAKLLLPSLKLVVTRRVDFSIRNTPLSRLKYTNRLVDAIVCISDNVRRVMLVDGVPERLLTTIHSGVDTGRHDSCRASGRWRARLGIPPQHLVVGTVAALVGHKDYPTLLRAAQMVLRENDQITFCALGDGHLAPRLKKMAARLKLGERFIFAGFQRQVGEFLANYDIFVLASHLEGLGTSILDAQAMGLAVVACRSGGIPEIVQDGHSGILVPPRNPAALAQAILALAADRRQRIRLGEQARHWVQRFGVQAMVARYLALYRDLLSR